MANARTHTPTVPDEADHFAPKAWLMSRVFPMEHNVVLVRIKSGLEMAGFKNVWFDHISDHHLAAFKMSLDARCPFRDIASISGLLVALAAALGLTTQKNEIVVTVRSSRVEAAIILQRKRGDENP